MHIHVFLKSIKEASVAYNVCQNNWSMMKCMSSPTPKQKPSRKQSPSPPSSTESRNRSYFSFEGSLIFRYIVSKCGINDAVPTTNSWLTGSKRRNTKMKAVTVEILAAAAALRHDWAFYIRIDVKIKRYACDKAHYKLGDYQEKAKLNPRSSSL